MYKLLDSLNCNYQLRFNYNHQTHMGISDSTICRYINGENGVYTTVLVYKLITFIIIPFHQPITEVLIPDVDL